MKHIDCSAISYDELFGYGLLMKLHYL